MEDPLEREDTRGAALGSDGEASRQVPPKSRRRSKSRPRGDAASTSRQEEGQVEEHVEALETYKDRVVALEGHYMEVVDRLDVMESTFEGHEEDVRVMARVFRLNSTRCVKELKV